MSKTAPIQAIIFAIITMLVSGVSSARAASWPVKFSDGTVVEIVGITGNGDATTAPAAAAAWWTPDGSAVENPGFRGSGSVNVIAVKDVGAPLAEPVRETVP